MSIASIYEHEVVTVLEDTVVSDAALLMRKHHVGEVIIVEVRNFQCIPIGLVTDRDLVVELVATELDTSVITVGDIMAPNLFVINESSSLIEALQSLSINGIRRLPVIDDEGVLVGILKLDSMLQVLAKESYLNELLMRERENEACNRH